MCTSRALGGLPVNLISIDNKLIRSAWMYSIVRTRTHAFGSRFEMHLFHVLVRIVRVYVQSMHVSIASWLRSLTLAPPVKKA